MNMPKGGQGGNNNNQLMKNLEEILNDSDISLPDQQNQYNESNNNGNKYLEDSEYEENAAE